MRQKKQKLEWSSDFCLKPSTGHFYAVSCETVNIRVPQTHFIMFRNGSRYVNECSITGRFIMLAFGLGAFRPGRFDPTACRTRTSIGRMSAEGRH